MDIATLRSLPASEQAAILSRLPLDKQQAFAKAFRALLAWEAQNKFHLMLPDKGPLRRELYPKHLEFFNALLVKDQQAQRLQAATVMASSPQFAPYVDNYTLLKRNFEILEVPTDGILLPEDKAREKEKAMAEQQPDPMIELKQEEVALKGRKIESDNEIAQGKMEIAAQDSQTKREIAMMNRDQAFATLALQEDLTFADIQAGMLKAREASSLKQQEMGSKARVEAEKLAAKERADAVEIAAERNRTPGPVLA